MYIIHAYICSYYNPLNYTYNTTELSTLVFATQPFFIAAFITAEGILS